jgi:4-amino-4-deoxy-L-arabinose transferase and related glycosyltransferases of PMT family
MHTENKKAWLSSYFKSWQNILTFIFLVLLAAAGFFLRIRNLGYLSFWGDDGHTVIGTLSILKYGYPKLPSGFILFHGILDYYLNVPFVLIFGATEFAFRLTSVVFGCASIIAIYFAGKEMANRFVGFLSAALIAFSTWYVYFSREARYFSALQFFFLISIYFFYKGFIKDQKPFRVLATVFFIISPLIHGNAFFLILSFAVLLLYKGRKFFKKQIIIPFLIIIFFYVLQIINQIFFWKVGRSFYSTGGGIRSTIRAYFKFPDLYYFKILKIMFPQMFYVFIFGAAVFIALAVFVSVRKSARFSGMYLSENELAAGRARFPFNILMLYFIFTVSMLIISVGQMYNQQRYIYHLMPLFILVFSYTVFVISMAAGSFCRFVLKRFKRFSTEPDESAFGPNKPGQETYNNGPEGIEYESFKSGSLKTGHTGSSGMKSGTMQYSGRMTLNNITAAIVVSVFVIISFFSMSGIDLKETYAIASIKHSDKLNTLYSISTVMPYHWDAADTGSYVFEHASEDDIVITTDIYNSYPYSRKIDYWLWSGNLVSWQPYHLSDDGQLRDDTYGVVVIRDIYKFIDVLNANHNKNVWVICSYSLNISEHIDPIYRKFFEDKKANLVLTGRDNVSKLYLFEKTDNPARVSIKDFYAPDSQNTIKPGDNGTVGLNFSDKALEKYLITGWGKVEKGIGTWGTEKTSVLFADFSGSSFDLNKASEISITAKPLFSPEKIQNIIIRVNSMPVGNIELAKKDDFGLYSISVAPGTFRTGANIIEFTYTYSDTPLKLGLGPDNRTLSVLFKDLEIKNIK